MKQHYIHLFEHNDWANKLSAASISETKNINPKAVSIFAHIVNAQQLWLNRILGRSGLKPWDERSLDESIIFSSQSTKDWMEFLKNSAESDIEKSISYQNSKGENFSNKIGQIINQVISHSSHHRGQIALLVRQSGGEPARTDYILFNR
ncbi:MAG: DinB family protein [Ignavibacteriales bacterium]|nr:MAG: DinB family protein [Ignavibacteriales bacterium]